MNTGENEQGLRKIVDWTRILSILSLIIHFYYYCYDYFLRWNLKSLLTDRLLQNLAKTGLFQSFFISKTFSLGLLIISLVGARGKMNEKMNYTPIFLCTFFGCGLYFFSQFVFLFSEKKEAIALSYIFITFIGYLLILTGGSLFSRIVRQKLIGSVFNSENETFPQEERLLNNAYSINLLARYSLNRKLRNSWINIINPFRGLLIMGTPGSGKSYFVIHQIIRQHIEKGFCMFVYDFKYDDLTRIAYNQFLKFKDRYKVMPHFWVINFDDLNRSHRCNPLMERLCTISLMQQNLLAPL